MRLLGLAIAAALVVAACGSDADEADEADSGEGGVEDVGDASASFEVEGTVAEMIGEIGSDTPDAVRGLLEAEPDLETIVLLDVPGSNDDVANLEASRMVRDAGLATHVPADGFIASGGVDFYLAGVDRTYEAGAVFGVHSWAAGDGTNGDELPRDHPEHDLFLDYYGEIGIDPDFYWFTLESAPPDDLHFMTDEELDRYDVGELVDGLD